MKIGSCVNVREDMRGKLEESEPSIAEILRVQGYLTIANRWKQGCDEPYWIAFVEVPGVAFPEEVFAETK